MSLDPSLNEVLVTGGAVVIGFFLRNMLDRFNKEVEKSRNNEKDLYIKIADEKVERLLMYIEILKDRK